MPLLSVGELQALAAKKAAEQAAASAAELAMYTAEATKAKPKLRRELDTKAGAEITKYARVGQVLIRVWDPKSTDGIKNAAYRKVWLEVIEAWGKTQKRKGYTVTTRKVEWSYLSGGLAVEIRWPIQK